MKNLKPGTIVREVEKVGSQKWVSSHDYIVVKILNKKKALCVTNVTNSCNRQFKLSLDKLEIVEGAKDIRFKTRDGFSYVVDGRLHFLGRQFIEDDIKKVSLWCYDGKGGTKSFICTDEEAMKYFDQKKTSEGAQAESIAQSMTRGW